MFARHPLESRESRISGGRAAEALRLSMMAELDAINMYLQFAESVEDERLKKLFADIAREEKTHLGEFLAALRELDEEQARELEEGFREAAELLGLEKRPLPEATRERGNAASTVLTPESLAGEIERRIRELLEKTMVFRKHFSVVKVPPGTPAVARSSEKSELVPLAELSVKFRVSRLSLDAARVSGAPLYIDEALRAAGELAREESRLVVETLREQAGVRLRRGEWESPGEALADIASALGELLRNGAMPPFVLILSPQLYAKLLAVYEKTGVLEIERVKALVGEVVAVSEAGEDAILASASPAFADIVVGADGEVEFLGPEDGFYVYRLRETIAVRVKNQRGVALLRRE